MLEEAVHDVKISGIAVILPVGVYAAVVRLILTLLII